ncbi:hypothetical protein RS030_81234 [Cryptosporidium xiaoi]|uniref:Uncharacterized protein n=1 Tax=Cryptosporidium xiaoi TaxID=659607 RepID=A0AAV9XW25_9CRYT
MTDETWNCGMGYIGIRLISSLKFLDFDDIETAKPCVRTLNGYKGCKLFLANIELLSDILKVDPGNRDYRQKFSQNYRTLFSDKNKRTYRVDVLEAAVEGYTSIWVNGERFEFKSEVILSGKSLYENWSCLVALIIQLKDLFEERIRQNKHLNIFEPEEDEIWKNNIRNTLHKFDNSWIIFEECYINELISIETIARRFILNIHNYITNRENNKAFEMHESVNFSNNSKETINLNEEISSVEKQEEIKGSVSDNVENSSDYTNNKTIIVQGKNCYEDLDTVFFDMIKTLYRVINTNNKESVSENINLCTWKLLNQINKKSANMPHSNISVFGAISENCISELICLIEEIKEICKFPERIDPHICNNIGLQQSIVKLEESWRLANKFISKLISFNEEYIGKLSLVRLVKFVQKILKVKESVRKEIIKKKTGTINDGTTCNIDTNLIKFDIETIGNSIKDSSHDLYNNFIERLGEFDVAAFLSLPKLCCLLFLLDPLNCSDIITQFLGITNSNHEKEENEYDVFTEKNCTTNMKNRNYFINNEFDNYLKNNAIFKIVDINRLFLLKVGSNYLNSNEESFKKMVDIWNKLSESVEIYLNNYGIVKQEEYNFNDINNKKIEFNEHFLLVFLFSILIGECLCGLGHINSCSNCADEMKIIVKNNDYNNYFKNTINSLIFSIEEVSMLMQRIYPSDWNEFIKIITICLTKTPDITSDEGCKDYNDESKGHKDIKSSDIEGQCDKDSSNGSKLKKLLNNVTSILYNNVKYYGEFTLTGDVPDVNTEFSTNNTSGNSSSSTEINAILQ